MPRFTEFVSVIWKKAMTKIITKAVLDMRTMQWIPELEESYVYLGEIALCKETDAQKESAQTLTNLTNQLQGVFAQNFGAQTAIMNNINNSIKATIAAGPSQYGYSAQEDAALRTQADTGTAQAYRQASQATNEQLAAVGGGNTFLPSGTAAVLKANNANAAAARRSNQNLAITSAGWQQGNQNYNNAVGFGAQQEQILNPAAYSSQALSGGTAAFNANTTIANEPTTGGVIGGILGSAAGSVVSAAGQAGGFAKLFS